MYGVLNRGSIDHVKAGVGNDAFAECSGSDEMC